MTLNGCSFDVPYVGEPAAGLDAARLGFEKLGYTVKKRADGAVTMAFKGTFFGTDPAKFSHSATVEVFEGGLRFTFSTGLKASTWGKANIEWAMARAAKVLEGG